MIWEHLLTDADGQYVEVQSGRLFNQADNSSTLTPSSTPGLNPTPPIPGPSTGCRSKASRALSAPARGVRLMLRARATASLSAFRPPARCATKLEVFDGNRLLATRDLNLKPCGPVEEIVPLATPPKRCACASAGTSCNTRWG